MNIPLNIDWQQIILHLLNLPFWAGACISCCTVRCASLWTSGRNTTARWRRRPSSGLDQAKKTEEAYHQQLKQADEEIRQEKAQAQQTMKRAAQQRMDEADKQAQAILATAREAAERYHDKAVQDTQKELQELAVTAAEKLVLQSDGDALDQFLDAAERGSGHEHTQQ